MVGAGIFDVIGPVMVGPSSSHTAGAARLGSIARRIHGKDLVRVDFYLHGSFAQTYRGHGTDRALLGGVLGFGPDDERIRDAFSYAREQKIEYHYHTVDLGDVHPNTVKIVLQDAEREKCAVVGSSTGGGNILITAINDIAVEFTGRYPTIITHHLDRPGVVARATTRLSENNINIAFLKVFRQARGSEACMVIETDQVIGKEVLTALEQVQGIYQVIFIDTWS